MEIPNRALIDMYGAMVKIRYFEEQIRAAYYEDKLPAFDIAAGPVPGEMHLAAGQEPVAVGMMPHLEPGDAITATHRPHHVAIAQGVDLKAMAAEIFGKDTGLGHGKGGHMHLFSSEPNFGCSGIVGEGMPVAVGAALAFKKQGKATKAQKPTKAKKLTKPKPQQIILKKKTKATMSSKMTEANRQQDLVCLLKTSSLLVKEPKSLSNKRLIKTMMSLMMMMI